MATRNGGPINIAAITAYLAFTQVFLTYHQKQTIPCNGSVLFYLRVSCFFRSSFCNCICCYFQVSYSWRLRAYSSVSQP